MVQEGLKGEKKKIRQRLLGITKTQRWYKILFRRCSIRAKKYIKIITAKEERGKKMRKKVKRMMKKRSINQKRFPLFMLLLISLLFFSGCIAKKPQAKIRAYDFSHIEKSLLERNFYLNTTIIHHTTQADTDLQFKGITQTVKKIYLPKAKKITESNYDKEKMIYEEWLFKEKQRCLDELNLQQTEWCNQKKEWNDCEILPSLLIIKEKTGAFTKIYYCNNTQFIHLFSQHNATWMLPLITKE